MQKQESLLHNQPIRVALLGTGIFATSCTFPTIRKRSDKFQLVAVWSRRQESVEAFVEKNIPSDIETIPGYSGNDGLTAILGDDKVDAVAIALPFDSQPSFIERALRAGKHVLSEKPIAPTMEKALGLYKTYQEINRERQQSLQWSVAENFRYEPGIDRVAKALCSGEVGKPSVFSLLIRLPFKSDNKYLHTEWRSKPSWSGGLVPDVFVHSTALLRKVFGSYEPKQVSAITTSTADHIPSTDSMSATLLFADKSSNEDTGENTYLHGTVSLSFACTYVRYELEVTGDQGSVRLQRKTAPGDPGYIVTIVDKNGQEYSQEDFKYGGIENEFVAFAYACHSRREKSMRSDNTTDTEEDAFGDINTPLEAMRDLELAEACLKSGKEKGKPISLPLA